MVVVEGLVDVEVVPVVAVVVPVVVVPVVVPFPCTTIVAVMNVCRSQWNVYVPGVLNVHVPLHPAAVGPCGSGGTAPLLAPAVCVHELGCGPLPKSALCSLEPLGYENVTVPPCAIVACVEVLPLTSHAKSTAVNDALLGGDVPPASDGSTATAAPTSPANGKSKIRILTSNDRRRHQQPSSPGFSLPDPLL